jgi:hypothetical protein
MPDTYRMTPTLRARIAEIRKKLEKVDPTTGFLALPSTHQTFPTEVPRSYQEFLREVDGAACGVVMLFESEGLLKQQGMAKDLPGGRLRWFCIGSVEDYPIVIDGQTGAVHLVPLEGSIDLDSSLGDLDYFLATSVFGVEYSDFVVDPEADPWYQLVRS